MRMLDISPYYLEEMVLTMGSTLGMPKTSFRKNSDSSLLRQNRFLTVSLQ